MKRVILKWLLKKARIIIFTYDWPWIVTDICEEISNIEKNIEKIFISCIILNDECISKKCNSIYSIKEGRKGYILL